jgi:hypothetical protein
MVQVHSVSIELLEQTAALVWLSVLVRRINIVDGHFGLASLMNFYANTGSGWRQMKPAHYMHGEKR